MKLTKVTIVIGKDDDFSTANAVVNNDTLGLAMALKSLALKDKSVMNALQLAFNELLINGHFAENNN